MNLKTIRTIGGVAAIFLPCPAVLASVTLTFDSDEEGFIDPEPESLDVTCEWSDYNGGSLKISCPGDFHNNAALLDVLGHPELGPELQLAIENGGEIRYTVYMENSDIVIPAESYPDWFQLVQVNNSDSGFDQEFAVEALPSLGNASFPFDGTYQFEVTMPIEGAPTNEAGDGRAQFGDPPTYAELWFGLNSQVDNLTSAAYYIDDLTIEANEVAVVDIPQLELLPATPGLNLIAAEGQYSRAMVRNIGPDPEASWVGRASEANPVNYSFTIAQESGIDGYSHSIYLIPSAAVQANDYNPDPDYVYPTVARMVVARTGDGTSNAVFAYKVDAPVSNGEAPNSFFDLDSVPSSGLGGILATLDAGAVVGKWQLEFTSDTQFTIMAPDGTTASGEMLQATADLFDGGLYFYVASVPGSPAGIGGQTVLSEIALSGTDADFVDDFEFSLAGLETVPQDAQDTVVVSSDTPFWLKWSLPATGYAPEYSADLGASAGWEELPSLPLTVGNQARMYLFNTFDVIEFDEENGFFRLNRPD